MKLPLKLSRSRPNSTPSCTPSSPASSASPTSSNSHKSLRLPSLPRLGRSSSGSLSKKGNTNGAELNSEITEGSSSSSRTLTPTSPITARDVRRGKGTVELTEEYSAELTEEYSAAVSLRPQSMVPRYVCGDRGKQPCQWNGGMQEMQETFAHFDANGDGKISGEELKAVLASLGDETTSEEAALMVREADRDGDGFVDLEEFVELNKTLEAEVADEEMAAAFALFDLDKNGWITAEELQQVMSRLGGNVAQRCSMEECRRMIRCVDSKGLGQVDFEDFKRMMTPLSL